MRKTEEIFKVNFSYDLIEALSMSMFLKKVNLRFYILIGHLASQNFVLSFSSAYIDVIVFPFFS